MDVLQHEQWLLSFGTFLPIAGGLVMLFIPKREESLVKGTAVVNPRIPRARTPKLAPRLSEAANALEMKFRPRAA